MDLEPIRSALAGVTYNNDDGTSRQKLIARLRKGDRLYVAGEDSPGGHGYAVYSDEGQVGWVRSHLVDDIDVRVSLGYDVSAVVMEVTGGTADKPTRGVNVVLEFTPSMPSAPVDKARLAKAIAKYAPREDVPRKPGKVEHYVTLIVCGVVIVLLLIFIGMVSKK